MRKIIAVSFAVLALSVSANANAFGWGKDKKEQKVENNIRTNPPISSPGQTSAAENAQAQAQANQASKPATREERDRAKAYDLVAQSTFWMGELNKNPKDIEAATQASNALIGIGSYSRAIEVASIGLQANENETNLWRNIGISLISMDRNNDAIMALTKADSLRPNDVEIKNALGIAYDNFGQSSMAINVLNQALNLNPNNAVTLTNLGMAQALNGDLKAAETTLRRAQAIPAAPIQARQNLALIVALQGRFDESQQIATLDLPPAIAQANANYVRQMLNGGDDGRWKTTN